MERGGAGDGELVLVSGNPGHTDRLNTVAHLKFQRDRIYPLTLRTLYRREVLLRTFSERSSENKRRAGDDLFSIENSRKARLGGLEGLQTPAIMAEKEAEERKLRDSVGRDAKLKAEIGRPWSDVAAAIKVYDKIYDEFSLLERGMAFNSHLFRIARHLVRMAEETAKPNPDRLREYTDSALDSLKLQLFSEAPVYDDLEVLTLSDSLSMLVEMSGADSPLVKKVLAGKSPRERAAELVRGTLLKDVAERKKIAAGGMKAIADSQDPMIALARLVDGPSRAVRKTFEEKVEEPLRQAYAKIAKARFALYGTNLYPDATFTLRLAFVAVKGYEELGKQIPPWTTFAGLYQRAAEHDNQPPFHLPERWAKCKDRLDMSTPFNFVCTADIIGGNSGSPVVNRNGELVGIIFDGNIQSLVLDFIYTEDQSRALAVHSSAIREALRRVHGATALADELGH